MERELLFLKMVTGLSKKRLQEIEKVTDSELKPQLESGKNTPIKQKI